MDFLKFLVFIVILCLVTCDLNQKEKDELELELKMLPQCYLVPFHGDVPSGYKFKRIPNGYNFRYFRVNQQNLADNTDVREEGTVINPGSDHEELVVKGKYSYSVTSYGVTVTYTADKNGYRAHVSVRTYECIQSPSVGLLQNLAG